MKHKNTPTNPHPMMQNKTENGAQTGVELGWGWGGGEERMTQTVLHIPVDEVPQVVEQLAVVLQQQVIPAETGVLASKDDAISTEVRQYFPV